METEKSRRKLVGWKPYLGNLAARVLGRSAVGICRWSGLVAFGVVVFTLVLWGSNSDMNAGNHNDVRYLVAAGLCGCLCLVGLGLAKVLSGEVEKIEPVELITRHNTGGLPEVETLVRGSDQPKLETPAELLRAARYGQETPPEQLLRATQEKRGDP